MVGSTIKEYVDEQRREGEPVKFLHTDRKTGDEFELTVYGTAVVECSCGQLQCKHSREVLRHLSTVDKDFPPMSREKEITR